MSPKAMQLILSASLTLTAVAGLALASETAFREVVVDAGIAGDVKAIGDLDGDGRPDLVVGGSIGEDLAFYRNPDWRRTVIGRPTVEFTTDGDVGDVDGDGDLDIVVFDGDAGVNLVWFENPAPVAGAADDASWRRHPIAAAGSWGKDLELADFDGDGLLDVVGRTATEAFICFQQPGAAWQRVGLRVASLGSEGMASGDLDGDGRIDLVVSGAWLRNPGGPAARSPDAWKEHPVGRGYGEFKAAIADFNGDGRADIAYSASEAEADVVVWRAGPGGEWMPTVLVPDLDRAHTLRPADMDLDGDVDLVVAQMHSSAEKSILVLENLDGRATAWRIHPIAAGGLHNGVVADLDGDGAPDIFGANWTGVPPVRLWLNLTGRR